jgi:hypothetical protein
MACIYLRTDIGYPLTFTSGEYPHSYSYRWSRPEGANAARTVAAEVVSEHAVAFMAGTFYER